MSDYIAVNIMAKPTIDHGNLHFDDKGIEGVYKIEFKEDLSISKSASAALDVFHSQIPVKQLDDFEFVVFDPITGMILIEDENHDDYSYENYGETEKISDELLLCFSAVMKHKSDNGEPIEIGKVVLLADSIEKANKIAIQILYGLYGQIPGSSIHCFESN